MEKKVTGIAGRSCQLLSDVGQRQLIVCMLSFIDMQSSGWKVKSLRVETSCALQTVDLPRHCKNEPSQVEARRKTSNIETSYLGADLTSRNSQKTPLNSSSAASTCSFGATREQEDSARPENALFWERQLKSPRTPDDNNIY